MDVFYGRNSFLTQNIIIGESGAEDGDDGGFGGGVGAGHQIMKTFVTDIESASIRQNGGDGSCARMCGLKGDGKVGVQNR